MKKKSKKILACIGLIGTCASACTGAYLIMQKKKQCVNEMMTYLEEE